MLSTVVYLVSTAPSDLGLILVGTITACNVQFLLATLIALHFVVLQACFVCNTSVEVKCNL